MKLEQIYTGCLAQGAYYIESEGEAAVIDPLRETGPYLARAERNGAKIKYVLETHFHADFVSGHLDLAEKTGAAIVYGPTAMPGFKAHIAEDREVLRLGEFLSRSSTPRVTRWKAPVTWYPTKMAVRVGYLPAIRSLSGMWAGLTLHKGSYEI